MLDRYIDRPNSSFANGAYSCLDQFCYAEFLRYYNSVSKPTENNCQPVALSDEILEINYNSSGYPTCIPLMSCKEKLKCRKVPLVLRFHTPNKDKTFELYAHHLLFLFYPFRNETELKAGDPELYANKLAQPGVLDIVNENKIRIEPDADIVEDALMRYNIDNINSLDPFGQIENDETVPISTQDQCSSTNDNVSDFSSPVPVDSIYLKDEETRELIRSLNQKQRQIFDYICHWARNLVMCRSSIVPSDIEPFHIFLTGGGGCGKSYLIKTVY